MSAPSNAVEEPERDFLEVDDPVPGQNYVCMSFVSPEEVIADRNMCLIHSFLKTNAKEFNLDEEKIVDMYKDFLFQHEDRITEEFAKRNDFRTSVRGLKIRGTYDTLPEAQRRAKILQKTDPIHNVFVGQVGYWLPWDPAPHKVGKQEYANRDLNELIQKYEENQEARKEAFNKRVEREIADAKRKSEKVKEANRAAREKESSESVPVSEGDVQKENVLDQVLDQVMEQKDVWSQNVKENNTPDTNTDGSTE